MLRLIRRCFFSFTILMPKKGFPFAGGLGNGCHPAVGGIDLFGFLRTGDAV